MILSDRRRLRPPLNCRASGFVQSLESRPLSGLVLHLRPLQSGDGIDLQNSPGADDVLCRIFGSEPYTDAARARLLKPTKALSVGRVPCVRSSAATGGRENR